MKTRTIETGINGQGARVWLVITEWINKMGRPMSFGETFDTEAEAVCWAKWA